MICSLTLPYPHHHIYYTTLGSCVQASQTQYVQKACHDIYNIEAAIVVLFGQTSKHGEPSIYDNLHNRVPKPQSIPILGFSCASPLYQTLPTPINQEQTLNVLVIFALFTYPII